MEKQEYRKPEIIEYEPLKDLTGGRPSDNTGTF